MKTKKTASVPIESLPDGEELPEGWEHVHLSEVSELISGAGFPEKYQGQQNLQYPFFKVGNLADVKSGDFLFHSSHSVDEKIVKELHAQIIPPNSIVFAKIGMAIRLNRRRMIGVPSCIDNNMMATVPNKRIIPKYLLRFLETVELMPLTQTTTVPSLRKTDIEMIKVPLPPLPEQQRIVARVEALLSHVNAARDRLSRVPVIMKRFRQGVLGAACSGRLTEGWREDNSNEVPASQLLQEIKKIRLEQKIQNIAKKAKKIQDVEIETTQKDTIDIPDSWAWCQIQDIAQVHLGGTPSRKESPYWGGTISWISSGEVANNRILTTREKITDLGLQNSNAKLYPKGTVLIAMIGEGKTRGQSAILDIEATTNQNVAGLVFDTDKIFNEFVWLWALSQYEKTRAVGRGGEQPALNGEKVRNLMLALPPLAEQHEIVRRVNALFERADAIEREVVVATKRTEALTQAVLGKAFKGELSQAGIAEGKS